ncbi:LOW QUALITY PROTEIN: ionotropic receptor 21a-like [Panulirus ornatus]|uniref:LOW QUALITY PROTEIN: ionotropic receptor 21a-like n=1 Tax=Panulirus ornatus TaxID=150431 RepID=UPI003A86C732
MSLAGMVVVWVAVLTSARYIQSLNRTRLIGSGDKTLLAVANHSNLERHAIVFSKDHTGRGELSSPEMMLHTRALPVCKPSHGLLRRTVAMRQMTQDSSPTRRSSGPNTSHTSILDATLEAVEQVVTQHLGHCLLMLGPFVSDDPGLENLLKKVMKQSLMPTLVVGPRTATSTTEPRSVRSFATGEARSGNVSLVSGCVAYMKLVAPGAVGPQPGWSMAPHLASVTAPHTYLFLLAPHTTDAGNTTPLLLDPNLPSDVEAFLLLPAPPHTGVAGEVHVYRRCLHCVGGGAGVRLVDTWAAGGFIHQRPLTDDQLRDFHGHVFQTVTMDFPPFVDYTRTEDEPGKVTLPKDSMDIRILQTAARALNFSFVLREPADGQWGYLLANGSWTGTVGTVQRSEADFSLMLSITWERTYAVSFTRAYYVEPMTFVVRKPGPLPQWQAPLKPFHWQVWLAVAVSVLLSGPILWLILRSVASSSLPSGEGGGSREEKEGGGGGGRGGGAGGKEGAYQAKVRKTAARDGDHSFGLVYLYMVAPIFGEPVPLFPRSSSGRVFCGMWWFFCILTTTMYRGSLIARLTVPEQSPTLDALEQLASSNLQWGMLDTYGSGYQLFRASKVPVYQALFQKMEYYNMNYSMERVLQGDYAFISWKTYFRNLIARDYTDRNGVTQVHIAREEFFPGGFGWAFPMDSPYLAKFDEVFQRLIESGLIDKWMTDLIRLSASENREAPEVVEAEGLEGSRAFTVYHLQGIFFIMLGGYLMAVLAFVSEVLLFLFLSRRTLLP